MTNRQQKNKRKKTAAAIHTAAGKPCPAVTIIVPVYNAQATLGRCADSILRQEYRDFELLLVDDGSTDGAAALCDRYAERDGRVRVFHQPNGGVSRARNLALDNARGTYIQFADSDDWLAPDATKRLVEAARANDSDLVIADFYRVVGERLSRKGSIREREPFTRKEYAAYMMKKPADFYYGVLWNKLFRRSIIEEHGLRMNPAVSWCEDFLFNLEYIGCAQRFLALQVPLYYYCKTKGSLASQGMSLSKTARMKATVFGFYHTFYKNVFSEKEYEKIRFQVYRFLVDAAGDGAVPPLGAQKLGGVRLRISRQAVQEQGTAARLYRENRLLDVCLLPLTERFGLRLEEARLLACLVSGAAGEKAAETDAATGDAEATYVPQEVPLSEATHVPQEAPLSEAAHVPQEPLSEAARQPREPLLADTGRSAEESQGLGTVIDRQELAERLYQKPQSVVRTLQQLSAREILKYTEETPKEKLAKGRTAVQEDKAAKEPRPPRMTREKRLRIVFSPQAEPLLEEVRQALRACEEARLSLLTPQERALYEKLQARIDEAVRGRLLGEI